MSKAIPSLRVAEARVEWLDSGLPYSRDFDDVYFSRADARGESRHVFLEAHGLPGKWQSARADKFHIAELGFGCGLNFLQTWQLWQQQAGPERIPRLHYSAFELHPLGPTDLARALQQWPELAPLATELLAHYPPPAAGCHRLHLAPDVLLDLYYGDALQVLQSMPPPGADAIDAWYADGFSPARNPELWQATLFHAMARHSAAGALLSTYSVAGVVRRNLESAGFELERLPGYGRKREMLRARLTGTTAEAERAEADPRPWFRGPRPQPREQRALVAGAGLAGLCTAKALARRGWRVTVIDQAESAFAGASGNRQLALRCRLIAEASDLASFYLHAYLYARRMLGQFPAAAGWHGCGVLQLDGAINQRRQPSPEKLLSLYGADIIRRLDERDQNAVAGAEVAGRGWYFPGGGWLEPERLAEILLADAGIDLLTGQRVQTLQSRNGLWSLQNGDGQCLASAPVLVLANGAAVTDFEPTRDLPVSAVRGQTSALRASTGSSRLATVLCGPRTIFPAHDEVHTLAASYAKTDLAAGPSEQEDRDNLQLARESFVNADCLGQELLGGRVSLRATTPDRVPLLGPVPDLPAMRSRFRDLARDASSQFDVPGCWLPGLYVNAGHGSNGLASAPFCAEILASLIDDGRAPVSGTILEMLNPVRFLIRDLKRQQHGD